MDNFIYDMTLEEVALAEQLAGAPIDEMLDEEKLKGKSMTALVYVIKKRTEPNFTFDEAKKYKFKEAAEIIRGDKDDPKAH